jgi:hypothetical protein
MVARPRSARLVRIFTGIQRNIIVQVPVQLQRRYIQAGYSLQRFRYGWNRQKRENCERRFRWCFSSSTPASGGNMRFGPFLGIAILLMILWLGGFLMFHVASGLIHLLLLFAVISLIVHFVTAPKTA